MPLGFLDILPIAVGLAMDTFAISVGAASSGRLRSRRSGLRLAFHFGLFQFLMPVAGWFLGTAVAPLIASFDHWIAFTLLAFVGARMLRSGFDRDARAFAADPSRGATLVMLSVATSLDAFAVGLSLAMLRVPVWYPSLVIGVVTAVLSLAGLALGSRLGAMFGRRMEAAGGVLLIGVGLHILISHLRA